MSAKYAKYAKLILTVCFCALLVFQTNSLLAQDDGGGNGGNGGGGNGNGNGFGGNDFYNGVVGGVAIDTHGVISGKKQVLDANLQQWLKKGLQRVDADIEVATSLRMISLRGLEAAITKARAEGRTLPQDVQFMAGLQRIEFVVLSPETNDIIIAGPGESWKLADNGDVVGVTSGTPVIHLEDFLVAMRSVDNARSGRGISVSIDPTEQGVKELRRLFKTFRTQNVAVGPALQPAVEEAMGQHVISLTGVPEDSRFAQVLVAADYKMKRLSMGLEEAPIANFPSFMEIAVSKKARSVKAAPRFWMECNYQPVAKSEDGLVWQIRGSGVKTMTQESHFNADGTSKTTQKQNLFAAQWAKTMTDRFDELSVAEPAFRELRNVMDLAVIAAIIKRERLDDKVELKIPAIYGVSDVVATPSWNVPKSVPTQCSFVKISRSWLISASGGVLLNSWGVADKTETVPQLAGLAQKATTRTADRWWWNAAN